MFVVWVFFFFFFFFKLAYLNIVFVKMSLTSAVG